MPNKPVTVVKIHTLLADRLRIGATAHKMSLAEYADYLTKDINWAEIDALRRAVRVQLRKEKVA
jgi:hypothetical protein